MQYYEVRGCLRHLSALAGRWPCCYMAQRFRTLLLRSPWPHDPPAGRQRRFDVFVGLWHVCSSGGTNAGAHIHTCWTTTQRWLSLPSPWEYALVLGGGWQPPCTCLVARAVVLFARRAGVLPPTLTRLFTPARRPFCGPWPVAHGLPPHQEVGCAWELPFLPLPVPSSLVRTSLLGGMGHTSVHGSHGAALLGQKPSSPWAAS